MELFDVVHAYATLFTVLSALLVAVILGRHFRDDVHLCREADFRQTTEPVIKNYLSGSVRLKEAVTALKKNPPLALTLLLDFSEAATSQEIAPLRALGKSMGYLQPMLAGLTHGNEADRLQNAQRLGYLRDESAVPELMKALDDPSPDVRLAAAQSLALLECSEAVKTILLNSDFAGEMPRDRVVEVLVQFGTHALAPLAETLNDPQASDKTLALAVQASGMLQAKKAVPHLVKVLQHKTPQLRRNTVCALAAIGDSKAIVPLSRLAEDLDPEVKSDVMLSLGALKAQDQIPLVVRALNDPAWEVRLSAAQALYQMGKAGRKALENAAGHEGDSLARNISRQILQEHGHALPAGRAFAS